MACLHHSFSPACFLIGPLPWPSLHPSLLCHPRAGVQEESTGGAPAHSAGILSAQRGTAGEKKEASAKKSPIPGSKSPQPNPPSALDVVSMTTLSSLPLRSTQRAPCGRGQAAGAQQGPTSPHGTRCPSEPTFWHHQWSDRSSQDRPTCPRVAPGMSTVCHDPAWPRASYSAKDPEAG